MPSKPQWNELKTPAADESASVTGGFSGSHYRVHRLFNDGILCHDGTPSIREISLVIERESSDRKIEIKDFDASVVEAMLHFMYYFNYNNACGTSTLVYDAQVYQIADKYDIPALKEHCKSKFSAAITTGWSLDDFPLAITVAYESTPSEDRGLRDLVVETSRKHIDKLLGNDSFCKLLRKTSDFSADLIPFLSDKTSTNAPRYECPSCQHQFRGEFSGKSYYCPNCAHRLSNWTTYRIGD
ncbi:hypothetical protein CEP53_014516 [Fusarium sp. AF-6]|nr:hypothetical protein CEP53_014516 [Fusarium sp. AF-6]